MPSNGTGWKAFYFRADPLVLDALKAGNFRCVALANNHMLDFGDQGLADTPKHLDAAGIAFAGAGADADEAMEPTVFDAGQTKVGFDLDHQHRARPSRATPDRPGTNYWKIGTDRDTVGRLAGLVDELRQRRRRA